MTDDKGEQATLDDVVCPWCITPCKTEMLSDEGIKPWLYAECLTCGYEMNEGAWTVREMLYGAGDGTQWNSVNLPAWTRFIAATAAREEPSDG